MGSWSNVCGGVEVVAGSLSVENWYTDALYQKGDSDATGSLKQKLVRQGVEQEKRISEFERNVTFLSRLYVGC